MICAKCHLERPTGREYRFFYGTKGSSTTYRDFDKMQKVTSTPYKIAGQAAAWICDVCVSRRKTLYLAGMLLAAAVFQVLTGREEFGEKVAIGVQRKDLAAQGHNAFLTPRQMEKMRRDA